MTVPGNTRPKSEAADPVEWWLARYVEAGAAYVPGRWFDYGLG